ncbi:hypothetical protein [Ekhidna sp.]
MKNSFNYIIILALLLLSSCGSDDSDYSLEGQVQFDGTTMPIRDGLFSEIIEDGSYSASFYFTESPVSFDEKFELINFTGEYLINVIIFSVGDSFAPGNYAVIDTDQSVNDKNAYIIMVNEENARAGGLPAIGGALNIQGSGDAYTLSFVADFEDGRELQGNVSGKFGRINITF